MKIELRTVLAAASGLLLCSASALAQAPDRAKDQAQKKELPKSGSLSSSITGGYQNRAVAEPWGGTDSQGENVAPISGSVFRNGPRDWKMTIFNNSDDTYSVSVEVAQYGSTGNKIKGDNFSYTLRPRGSEERLVTGNDKTKDAQLNLRSWRKIGGSKPTPAAAQAAGSPPPAAEASPAGAVAAPGSPTLSPGIPVSVKQ